MEKSRLLPLFTLVLAVAFAIPVRGQSGIPNVGSISGTLQDSATKSPRAGDSIYLGVLHPSGSPTHGGMVFDAQAGTVSDAKGRFHFSDVATGAPNYLQPAVPGYREVLGTGKIVFNSEGKAEVLVEVKSTTPVALARAMDPSIQILKAMAAESDRITLIHAALPEGSRLQVLRTTGAVVREISLRAGSTETSLSRPEKGMLVLLLRDDQGRKSGSHRIPPALD